MSQREVCHACELPVGERTWRIDPIITEAFTMCDVCYRLYELGIIDTDGRLLVVTTETR